MKVINEPLEEQSLAIILFGREKTYEFYSYFYDELINLSKMPLKSNPSIRELRIPSHKLAKGYSIIHYMNKYAKKADIKYKVSFIELLCLISVSYIFDTLEKVIDDDAKLEFEAIIYKLYEKDEVDMNNLLRISDLKPNAIYGLFKNFKYMKEERDFDIINNLWIKRVSEQQIKINE